MKTIGTANSSKGDSYLIQYLRKSKLFAKNTNLGEYINSVLNTILDPSNIENYKLCIYGSCWGKCSKKNGYGPVSDLINVVFNNVPTDLSIDLINNYRGYNSNDIFNYLINYYHNVSNNKKDKDHAKLVKLIYRDPDRNDDEVLFYMIGSSNFSKTTYLSNDGNVDQCDIAFIKNTRQTNKLISTIFSNDSSNETMLNLWREATNTEINPDINNDEYLEKIKNSTYLTLPYISNTPESHLTIHKN